MLAWLFVLRSAMMRQSAIKVLCHFCRLCRGGHLILDDGGLSFVHEMHSALHCVRGEFRFLLFLCVPSSNFSRYHLNQFSHASSCSSNGISSSTQGLHADGRPASLASSLWMWAMIIPFTRCQTLSQRFMHSKSGDKSTGSTVSYLGKRCPFTQESNRSKALSLKIQSREDSSPE